MCPTFKGINFTAKIRIKDNPINPPPLSDIGKNIPSKVRLKNTIQGPKINP